MKLGHFEHNARNLEVVGTIGFSDADGRPFVSLDIASIGGQAIGGNDAVFALTKALIPEIKAIQDDNEFDVRAALSPTTNPVGDPNRAHASILYSFAFSADKEIKAQQIERAKNLLGTEVRFTITTNQFKLVTAANALKDAKTKLISTADCAVAPTLGPTRNTIVTIEMDIETQNILCQISRDILDDQKFLGNTDRSGKVQPYHICIGQAQLAENIFLSANVLK